LADSDDDSPPPPSMQSKPPPKSKVTSGARVSKYAIVSDDEDAPRQSSRRKSRASTEADSEADRDLKAMMDVDDGKSPELAYYSWALSSAI
jgi:hypothetical protein